MNEQTINDLRAKIAENIEKDIAGLKYDHPANNFEHIWNCAIDKAEDCCNGYD